MEDMLIVVKNPKYYSAKEEGELSDDDEDGIVRNEGRGETDENMPVENNNNNKHYCRKPSLFNNHSRGIFDKFGNNMRDSSCGNNVPFPLSPNRSGEDGPSGYFKKRRPPPPPSLSCGMMNPGGRRDNSNPMPSDMCGSNSSAGISGGYWAPPPPLRPHHPSRIPQQMPPMSHHPYRPSPPRCPVGPGVENLGPVGHGQLPSGNRDSLPPGPWQDNRRYGPMTPRSNFQLWEKKRRMRESRGSLFSGGAHQMSSLKENSDYEDLLRKYRSIQKQIANLDEEENLAVQDKSTQSPGNKNWDSYRTISVSSKGSQSHESSSESNKKTKSRWNPPKSGSESNDKRVVFVNSHKAEDEDDELEELRRIALASTSENNKPKPSVSKSSQSKPVSRSRSETLRRKTNSSNRSSYKRESTVLREQSCNKSGIKRKLGFLKHRPAYRSCRRRLSSSEDKSKLVNNQRREINKILEVDDPVEQIERLTKYLSEKKKELAINNKSPSCLSQLNETKSDGKTSKVLQDNYEEVAMEIDSDDGLVAVSEIEDIHIQREPSLMSSISELPSVSDRNGQDLNFESNPKNWVNLIPPPPPPPPLPPPPPPPPPPPLVDKSEKVNPNELSLLVSNVDSSSQVPYTLDPLRSPNVLPLMFHGLVPPLPPPPPLPDEKPPEKPPEPDYEEDEEEEKLLRAQLLQSMAIRRKESVQIPPKVIVDDTSGKESPFSPRSQSPHSTDASIPDKKQPPQQQPYCAPKIPKHPSVVINLAEDSTDSEHEAEPESQKQNILSGIDQFLKDARKSVETKKNSMESKDVSNIKKNISLNKQEVDLYTADRGFRELEEKYVAQRKLMLQDQRELKALVTQASKVLTKIKSTEKKCEIFRKNLKNSDHLVAMYRKQDIKIKDKIQLVKIQLAHNESTVLQLEKNLLQIGKRLYGACYQPRTIAVDSAGNKRVLPLLSHNQLKTKIEDIPHKRQQLQQMQQQYALMLQRLQTQANKKITKSSVLQLEKISLDCTEEAETASQQIAEKIDSRRRSLISLNSKMKPEIIQNKENIQPDIRVPQQLDKTEYNFEMPENSQLANLKTILHEKMQNLIEPAQSKTVSWEIFSHLTPPLNSIPYPKSDNQSMTNLKMSQTLRSYKPYKSPLLHFRAYRFSPFLRTKENLSLSSHSFSHKLNCKIILCQYDLQGTCNDQQCKSQHLKDYSMSTQEILQDIVSYAPALTGASKEQSGEKIAGQICDYVENIMNQNQGRMTVDELCLLQISKVNEFVHHVPPHTMFFEPRCWKPHQESLPDTVVDIDKIYTQETDLNPLFLSSKPDALSEWEDIIEEQDVRYFDIGNNTAAILDLEAAVLENPQNEQLWLKLAYKKLSSRSSDTESGHLDQALNVLARGLENMKQSPDLWQYYLQLYSQHPDSKKDLVDMCCVAIQNAPSYTLWWQYLCATENYFSKIEICKQMHQYLKMQEPSEVVSQHITEVSLYRLGITVVSNRFKTGLLFFKNLLQTTSSHDEELMSMLRPSDRALLWLCYIYLNEFQRLPDQLYDSTGHFLDHLFPKSLHIDWYSHSKLQCDIKFLQKLYQECLTCLQTDGERTDEHDKVSSEVYCSFLKLLHSQSRTDEALSIGREVLMKWPHLDDVWLSMAEFYSADKNVTAVWQIFDEALKTGCYSAKLYLYASHMALSLTDSECALRYLEQASISCFLIDITDSRCDPNILYCCLLRQTIPLDYKIPDYCENISPEVLQKNQLYFWLTYCLLLELQSDYSQAIEGYETALSTMKSTSDIAQVWLHYLNYQIRQAAHEGSGAADKLQSLVIRSLTCLPSRVETSTSRYWHDHQHHNKIIDLYINCLESTEQKMAAYDKFLTIMPNNIELILRAVDLAVSCNDMWRALSFCQTGVHEKLPCISLWNKVTALTVLRCSQIEVQQLFIKAVRVLPYAVSLWKHFLLFEVTIGAKSNVLQIIQRCQQLGLNIDGFVKTISR